MIVPRAAAATGFALVALTLLPAAATGREDPAPALAPLEIAPFRMGLTGWEATGPADVFSWVREEATLEAKGKAGAEPGRLVFRHRAWDEFEASFRLRKGTTRLRFLLAPEDGTEPVALDIPRGALATDHWTEGAVRVGGARAVLAVGKKETSAALPAGARVSLGFEAANGAAGAVTELRLVRRYVPSPQDCEEGFRPLFDGESPGRWTPSHPDEAPSFDVAGGILRGVVRTRDAATLLLPGEPARPYELRFRALWGTTGLTLLLGEPPSLAKPQGTGHLRVLLASYVDEEDVSDVVLRVRPGGWTVDVNGRRVVDETPGGGSVAPRREEAVIGFVVARGDRLHVRDLRIRTLDEDAAPAGETPAAPR